MTSYLHGVYVGEAPTSIRPPVTADAGLPCVVGAAPVCLGTRANVNKPVLCMSYAEFLTKFGTGPVADYSLSEFAKVYFSYGVGPIVVINVLDPADLDHMTAVPRAAFAWTSGQLSQTIAIHGIDHTTVVIDDGAAPTPTPYPLTTGYTLAYDDDGYTVVTRLAGGAMGSGALPACMLTYSKMKPSGVVAADVIGSVTGGGVAKGLYCLEDVYPRLQYAPGLILAPGFSHDPTVMAAMVARAASFNGIFNAIAVCDLDPDDYEIADYSEAAAWKSDNGYTSNNLICCWPKVTLGTETHWMSCHFAGLANQVDAGSGNGVPYCSPSNHAMLIDGTCLDDGSEVFLTLAQANALNGQGIVTAINWTGWRLWGNRTAGYPASSDPKDTFIPIRRMTLWLGNTLVLTYFSQVDSALNRRLIESVVDSANIYLNGLKGQQAILAGEVVFAEADNPSTDLLNGHATFRIYWTPPPPVEAITFIVEYDVTALAGLFS